MASRRRKLVLWTAVGVLVSVIGYVVGVGYYASTRTIDRVRYGEPETVLGVGPDEVTLNNSEQTRKPGTFFLSWGGGFAKVGDIIEQTPQHVRRRLLDGGVKPTVGATVGVNANVPGDPRTGLGLDYKEVSVPTELGPAAAWYIPASKPNDTWVIGVHGQNGKRNAVLHPIPTLHRLGFPVLAISYRNHLGAPTSPDKLIHWGESEWRDLEAAVRTAKRMGAKRVVLYGGSICPLITSSRLTRLLQT